MRLSAEIELLDSTVKWNRSVMSPVQPSVPFKICDEIIGSHAMMRHNVMVRLNGSSFNWAHSADKVELIRWVQ